MRPSLLLRLALWLALALMPATAWTATYHVAPGGDDTNPGTRALPWRTIAQANSTLQAGDSVLLHAGIYEDAIWPDNQGLSNDQRITYRAFGDGDVVLTGFPLTGAPSEGALALGATRYITVSGRAAGDPVSARRIRLAPQADINSLASVCGSEGIVVENIYAECPSSDRNCSRGFVFCLNFWEGAYETRYNVLRNSTLIGNSDVSSDANDYTEDLLTISHNAHHNLIENNLLTTCRHTSLYADSASSHSNVIRGNRILNPEHTALSIWSAGIDYPEGARFLVENNWLSASGSTFEPEGFPGNTFQWGADELIIRHNVITQGGSLDQQTSSIGGLMGATSTSFGQPYFATDGRIYNNSIVDNRGAALGMMDFGVDPVDLGRHIFVNNMIYGSTSEATGNLLAVYWDGSMPTSDRYIANVWGNPGGDPADAIISNAHRGFGDLATAVATWRNPQDPELTDWEGFPNRYDAAPGFVDYAGANYELASTSPYPDAGAPLTRVAAGDSGSGAQLNVDDARFFFAEAAEFPAWMGVEPEWIAIGSQFATAARAQIAAVDDTTGVVTLSQSVARQPGDYVWLWRDSSGREVVSGSAPAVGAFESSALFADNFESGDLSGWAGR